MSGSSPWGLFYEDYRVDDHETLFFFSFHGVCIYLFMCVCMHVHMYLGPGVNSGCFFLVILVFEAGFLYISLAILELTTLTRQALNSQRSICLCLPRAGMKDNPIVSHCF